MFVTEHVHKLPSVGDSNNNVIQESGNMTCVKLPRIYSKKLLPSEVSTVSTQKSEIYVSPRDETPCSGGASKVGRSRFPPSREAHCNGWVPIARPHVSPQRSNSYHGRKMAPPLWTLANARGEKNPCIGSIENVPKRKPFIPLREQVTLQVAELANELTVKILIHKPQDLAAFCADYLERKLHERRKENEKVLRLSSRRFGDSKQKAMLKATARVTSATAMEGVLSGMQDFDPLKDQVSLPDTGSRVGALSLSSEKAYSVAYNPPEKPCKSVLKGHHDTVTQSWVLDSYVVTASLDRTIRVWDLNSGDVVSKLTCHQPVNVILCVRMPGKPSTVLLLAGCGDGRIPTWTLNLGSSPIKCQSGNILACHRPNPIRAMAVSPNRQYLATGCCFLMNQITLDRTRQISVRGTVKTWNFDKMIECGSEPTGLEHSINHVSLKTMKQLCATIISRKTIYSRNANDFEEEKYLGIRAMTYTPDSKMLVVGFGHPEDISEQDFKMMVVCCAETLTTLWADEAIQQQINALAFSHHGLGNSWMPWHLFVSNQGQLRKLTLQITEMPDKINVRLLSAWEHLFPGSNCFHAALSPDGALIASGCGKQVCLWDAETGRQIATYEGHKAKIFSVHFSCDGQTITSTSSDQTCHVWKAPIRTVSRKEDSTVC